MDAVAELAGFFAAHAVWCVSDGESLIPFAAYDTPGGKREMVRFAADRLENGVAAGKEWIAKNPEHASRAVLVFDGFVTLTSGKTDAIAITARDFTQGDAELTIAVPYRPATNSKGFAVHRPKFLGYKGAEPNFEQLAEALWRGVAKHEKGAEIWNAHLDESR